MAFSEKLKKARQQANLSQAELAEKLGLNLRTYGSYERGERDVSTALLRLICKTLNISSDELLENELDMKGVNSVEIGKLIYKRRTELHLTLEEVGNAVGVSKSTVKKWEDGFISNMRRDKIAQLARVLQISPVSLITGEEEYTDELEALMARHDNIKPVKLKRFPMLGEIACGEPTFAEEEREHFVMADMDIEADFCLRAKGDSMINARIYDGDIVFIKEMPIVENGEIAAVIIEDEATLKRFYYDREANYLQLVAENPKYKPLVYKGEELDQIRVLGQAVYFMSAL